MTTRPRFYTPAKPFYSDLKARVKNYFESEGTQATGTKELYFKAGILVGLTFIIYAHLIFFTPNSIAGIFECALLGILTASIGFNVMHDGSHGSFSRSKILNGFAAFSLNVFGGNSFMWNLKHNLIHHSYTNVDGFDDDINVQPWLRMSKTQNKYKLHKYQHIYFWFLYAQLFLFWVFVLDYQKYFRKKIGAIDLSRMAYYDHLTFWIFKAVHAFLFVALPIYQVGFLHWLVGFFIFNGVAGLVLSLVFQLAHTVEATAFPMPDENTGQLADDWAIHQIKTTSNFATGNRLISWLLGGLNFQVEHHLFPKISHVHYPAISQILRETCREYGIRYIEYTKVRYALASHIAFLKQMGSS